MKYINIIYIAFFLYLYSPCVYGFNLCEEESEYLVGFFNGVDNDKDYASGTLKKIIDRYGESYNGIPIKYDLFYNETVSVTDDVLETLDMDEIEDYFIPKEGFVTPPYFLDDLSDHFEFFWYPPAIIDGEKNIDTEGIYNTLVNLVSVRKKVYTEKLQKLIEERLPALAVKNIEEHKVQLEEHLKKRRRALLIAHSQGNLFVNMAFDRGIEFLQEEHSYRDPSDTLKTIKVIHVAPASRLSRGPYLLGDTDDVIRVGLGSLSMGIRYIPAPNLRLPLYKPTLPIIGPLCGSDGEPLGHGFREIYFNEDLLKHCDPDDGYDLPIAKFDDLWNDAMSKLEPPPGESKQRGLFTVSMRKATSDYAYFSLVIVEPWPFKRKIHRNSMTTGTYGLFSIYDDDQGNPVQQYEENCEITEMLGGVYEVGIAQYTGTFEDKVIIEVKTYDGKVLYRTRPFGMTPLNNYTSVDDFMHVVDINVKYNFEKKKYEITLERVLDVRE